MKRRAIVLLLVVLAAAAPLMAEDVFNPKAIPHMAPGNFAAALGLNLGWGFGVSGGVELMLGKFTIPDAFPLSYGLAARGSVTFPAGVLFLSAGGFGTLHFSFNSIAVMPEVLQKFDIYGGLGVGFNIAPYFNVRFATISGTAYHLNKNMAIILEGVYYGGYGFGSLFGIQLKL